MPIYTITFKYKAMYSKEIKLDPVSRFLSGKTSKVVIIAAIIIIAYLAS